MKSKKELKGASKLGVKIRKDAALNSLSGKILFPKKLEAANKIISKLRWKPTD